MDEKQELSYGLYEELVKHLQVEKKVFFNIGKILKTIREDKLYEHIGEGGYDTWIQFLNAPEINLTQARAYFYIRVYEFYIEKMNLSEKDLSEFSAYKLFRLLPIIREKSKTEAMAIIDKVRGLGVADTEAEISEQKGETTDKPAVYQCKDCDKWRVDYKEEQICRCDDYFHLTNKSFQKGDFKTEV